MIWNPNLATIFRRMVLDLGRATHYDLSNILPSPIDWMNPTPRLSFARQSTHETFPVPASWPSRIR